MKIFAQQQTIVRPREMPDQLRQRLEGQLAEAAVEPAGSVGPPVVLTRRYHIAMDRTQVFQQMRLLLEHGHTESTSEGFLAGVHSEMRLEIPRHAELLAAVLAAVLPHGRLLAGALLVLGGRRLVRAHLRLAEPRAPRPRAGRPVLERVLVRRRRRGRTSLWQVGRSRRAQRVQDSKPARRYSRHCSRPLRVPQLRHLLQVTRRK